MLFLVTLPSYNKYGRVRDVVDKFTVQVYILLI